MIETRRFVESDWLEGGIRCGWPMVALFGISAHAPMVRVDAQGLVTSLALSCFRNSELQTIAEDHAVIRTQSGSPLTHRRFMPGMDAAVLWWNRRDLDFSEPPFDLTCKLLTVKVRP
jgi:hypothetical protein